MKSACHVLLRTRPPDGSTNPNIQYQPDGKTVSILVPVKERPDVKSYAAQGVAGTQYQFKFDGVLRDSSQEDVFEAAAADVLRRALDGYNGTIMCYGQTGAGKTFTMSGGKQHYRQRGLVPRLLTQLFTELKQRTDTIAKVSISYLEIYNESLYDLLDITTQPHELLIQEGRPGATSSGTGNVRVQGLSSVDVTDEAAALKLLFEGETNRVIGEHQLNRESSRSHSVFTVNLEMKAAGDESGMIMASKICLVDLAGSERVSKTKSEGNVLREAGHINKSLSILEQVIVALGDKGRDHVPFRSSKLTHVLKDSLGGNCLTVLIANIWDAVEQTEETISTCRFAQRMMRVTCEITQNLQEDNSARVKQLQRQVQELQQELALHDSMAGRQDMTYAPYTPEQRANLASQLDAFLDNDDNDSISPLDLMNLRHVREIMYCLKARVKAREAAAAAAIARAEASSGGLPADQARSNAGQAHDRHPSNKHGLKPLNTNISNSTSQPAVDGELSPTSAMVARLAAPSSVGGAAPDATGVDSAATDADADDPSVAVAAAAATSSMSHQRHEGPPPERHVALSDYKSGPGSAKNAILEDNRSRLKAAKKKAKELGLGVNAAKRDIDALKEALEQKKAARQPLGENAQQELSPEELDVLEKLKAAKKQYKDQFTELQMVRSEVEYTQQLCDTCAKEIVEEFQAWYTDTYGVEDAGPSFDASQLDFESASGAMSPTHSATSSHATSPPHASAYNRSGQHHAPALLGAEKSKGSLQGLNKGRGNAAAALPDATRRRGLLPSLQGQQQQAPGPSQAELSDPEALAFYEAQQAMLFRTTGVAHRPGSVKKRLGPPNTFSTTNRADITAKIGPDVYVKPGAATRTPN